MSVDASAVARVTGVSTAFKDLRAGGVQFLPQRIAVLAQGSSSVVYSATKRRVTSAPEAGSIYGYGSPIHLIVEQLLPTNGDGVGTVPVTIYPLADDGSGVAAAGSVTIGAGTTTAASAWRVRVSGILSNAFVIPKGTIVPTTIYALIGTAMGGVLDMPVTNGYTYGAVTASALVGTGNGTITALSVTGTPLPGAYTLKVTSAVANGGVWSLTDPNGTVVSSGLTQTVGAGVATVFNTAGSSIHDHGWRHGLRSRGGVHDHRPRHGLPAEGEVEGCERQRPVHRDDRGRLVRCGVHGGAAHRWPRQPERLGCARAGRQRLGDRCSSTRWSSRTPRLWTS
jgi:hypothetical protein